MNIHHNGSGNRLDHDAVSPAVGKIASIDYPPIARALMNAEGAEKKFRLFDITARNWLGRVETAADRHLVVGLLQQFAEETGFVKEFGEDCVSLAISSAAQPQVSQPDRAAARPKPWTNT